MQAGFIGVKKFTGVGGRGSLNIQTGGLNWPFKTPILDVLNCYRYIY